MLPCGDWASPTQRRITLYPIRLFNVLLDIYVGPTARRREYHSFFPLRQSVTLIPVKAIALFPLPHTEKWSVITHPNTDFHPSVTQTSHLSFSCASFSEAASERL